MDFVTHYLNYIGNFIDIVSYAFLLFAFLLALATAAYYYAKSYWKAGASAIVAVLLFGCYVFMPSSKPIDMAVKSVEVGKQVLESEKVKAGTEAAKGWLLKKADEAKELVK